MQRLIEQPRDEGEIWEGPSRLGRVHYHLSVYQHFSEIESEPVRTSYEVEGHIDALDPVDLHTLHRRRAELTLRLGDGRALEFLLANDGGTIHSTGRGLYTP